MSDSVQPQKRQPTRLPRPWDSPGKNTGVGCHFLLQCMKVKSESEVVQSCLTPSDPMDCSLPGSSVHGIFQALYLFVFLVPVFWWMELGLVLLVDPAVSWGVFWWVCELNTILGRLSADEWVSVPVLLVVWPEVFSTGAYRVLSGTSLETQRGT